MKLCQIVESASSDAKQMLKALQSSKFLNDVMSSTNIKKWDKETTKLLNKEQKLKFKEFDKEVEFAKKDGSELPNKSEYLVLVDEQYDGPWFTYNMYKHVPVIFASEFTNMRNEYQEWMYDSESPDSYIEQSAFLSSSYAQERISAFFEKYDNIQDNVMNFRYDMKSLDDWLNQGETYEPIASSALVDSVEVYIGAAIAFGKYHKRMKKGLK